jgi:hypothetical protein
MSGPRSAGVLAVAHAGRVDSGFSTKDFLVDPNGIRKATNLAKPAADRAPPTEGEEACDGLAEGHGGKR